MDKITSKNNNIIKDTKKLFLSPKARRESGLFVIEGARLCFDVLNSFYSVRFVLVTESLRSRYPDRVDALVAMADNAYLITDEIAERLSDTPTPQGIFAVCTMQSSDNAISSGRYVALDNVRDPSNIGAIIRTAEALGIDGLITCDCCDVYNPKALRASMGSVLRIPVYDTPDLVECINELKGRGFAVYSTVPSDTATDIRTVDFSGNVVSVIGNEANGVSDPVLASSDALITIPMLGRAESLNASVAASLTMWEMMR